MGHKDEQFLDEPLDTLGQVALDRRPVFQEWTTAGQQFPLQLLLDPPALPGIGMGEGFRPSVDLVDFPSPLGQFLVPGVEGPQVADVPQQVYPAPLLQAWVMVGSGIEVADQDPAKESPSASLTTSLF